MTSEENRESEVTVLMDGATMNGHLSRMAREISTGIEDLDSLVILGILRRGRPLADRLAVLIGGLTGVYPPVGSIATTLYRDDAHRPGAAIKTRGQTHFAFNLDERTVLLVDDVLAAGRTTRAALDEVMDYGRPRRIQLACLIDRGGRELPIQPDYLGWAVGSSPGEWVSVHILEIDGEDAVLVERRTADTSREGA